SSSHPGVLELFLLRSCFFYWSRDLRDLLSFPTRRSSDLLRRASTEGYRANSPSVTSYRSNRSAVMSEPGSRFSPSLLGRREKVCVPDASSIHAWVVPR